MQAAAAGFSGAVAQAFHRVRPAWQGCGAAAALILCIQHPLELAVHRMRGTPHWRGGVLVSMVFSVAAAAVNIGLMRRGFLIVAVTRGTGDLCEVAIGANVCKRCWRCCVLDWRARRGRRRDPSPTGPTR